MVNINLPNRRGRSALGVVVSYVQARAALTLLKHPDVDVH